MQVRPWGPSITPQAHLFKGDSNVVATKSKYDFYFKIFVMMYKNNSKLTTLRLQLSNSKITKWKNITNGGDCTPIYTMG